jgi:hypothetical protein
MGMNDQSPRLSDRMQRAIESSFANRDEAFALLDLIDAEFRSDPMSQQCFDARIVERVRLCVTLQKDLKEKYGPFIV